MDRRYFLKSSGIGLASFGLMAAAPKFLHQFANAATLNSGYGKKKVLVTIFQRGAVDGLNMLVPHGESEYYNLRPTIAVAKAGTDGRRDRSRRPFWAASVAKTLRAVLEERPACGHYLGRLARQYAFAL